MPHGSAEYQVEDGALLAQVRGHVQDVLVLIDTTNTQFTQLGQFLNIFADFRASIILTIITLLQEFFK